MPPSAAGRLAGLDAFRGLIIVLMALDHASYFVAQVHHGEIWSRPLPVYSDALPFLTRLVTHLCAPGFFLLMGVGTVFFADSRRKSGWPALRTSGTLALRGGMLIGLQFLVENPAWSLSDNGALRFIHYYGVLYGLGATLLFWSPLVRLPGSTVLALSVAAIAATQFLVPWLGGAGGIAPYWLGVLLVPGKAGQAFVLYPPIPWFGVVGLGILLGRLARQESARLRPLLLGSGLVALTAFLVARSAGVGDFHPPAALDWMSFLSVTKYPPSCDFLLLTLGAAALLLYGFLFIKSKPLAWGAPLVVFGRAPLVFYLTHLYVYALIGLALPRKASLLGMYPLWLAGLVLLFPLCRAYGRFKSNRAPASLWRLF